MEFKWMELVGGLGFFMLGMTMLSNGLKLGAGSQLERILSQATSTPLKGLGAGILVTAIVQSSSAVTVATIGFVNAGLLSLASALWVLFGASIGTTTTGWMVAIAGLKVNIGAFALPLVALGVVLLIIRKDHRLGYFGEAIAGIGLLFYGIMLMQAGFEGVANELTIPQGSGVSTAALQLLIGVVMTIITQSSSVSTVIAISAAQAGLIDVGGAAAVVIGANLGTKVAAIIAVIGGTPNAKRVATAHIIFHIIAATVGFILLPVLLWFIDLLGDWFGLDEAPATSLALFNTTFNIMGVVVLWPFVHWLTDRLQKWYVPPEEKAAAKPEFLDKTTLPVPVFAASALTNELSRMLHMAWDYLACTTGVKVDAPDRRKDLFSLLKATESFVDEMNRRTMDEATGDRVAALLRVRRYLENVLEFVFETLQLPLDLLESDIVNGTYLAYLRSIEAIMASYQNPQTDSDSLDCLSRFEQSYQTLKMALLRAGANGQWRVEDMERALHRISAQRRAIQQMVKAQRWLEYAENLSDAGVQTAPPVESADPVGPVRVERATSKIQATDIQKPAQ